MRLEIRVVPGAKRTRLLSEDGSRLRISVAAPPVENKANAELIRFLAELYSIPRSKIRIVRGARGRTKLVELAIPAESKAS